jgi:imidazolonepropionase-like amidohydrolase
MALNLHLRGVVLPGGVERDMFVTETGTLTFDGASADARTIVDGGFLVPGLVDAHAHLTISSGPETTVVDDEGVRRHARAQLAGGVLLVREPGGASRASARLGPDDGAPRMQSAGRWLAGPGRFFPGWAREVDGAELTGAAVEELRAADGGWVKVIGDWRVEDVRAPSFDGATLADLVRRVHDAGARVAIHAILAETVEIAIESGCDSIEHGTFASEGMVAAVAARGIALTPTIGAVTAPVPDDAPPVVRDGSAEMARSVRRVVRDAWEAGVELLAGTDIAIPHGEIRREIELLASCGVPPEAALAAGSWAARSFLGLPGIEEGAPADLVAYARDPREDLSVLGDPVAIVLDGGPVETHRR